MSEILTETLVDTLKMLPFLFGAYLLLEYVEHRAADRLARALAGAKSGVLGGALLGCLPQCGFSVAAANLYSGGLISAGTLLAVFLSTSDEALPILLAQPEGAPLVGRLLLVKILIALAAGLAMDTFSRGQRSGCGDLHRDCGEDASEQGGVLRAALRHTAEVFLFLLIVTLALNLVISWLGEQRLGALLLTGSFLQPFVAGLIGLIPNCAASVLLTELLLEGSISFGSAVAGLCTGAGMGLMVLFRQNKSTKDNVRLLLWLYGSGVLAGLLLQFVFA